MAPLVVFIRTATSRNKNNSDVIANGGFINFGGVGVVAGNLKISSYQLNHLVSQHIGRSLPTRHIMQDYCCQQCGGGSQL